MSDQGAFVFAAECPPLGASVGLRMDLEAFQNATGITRIEFEGQVVRVERPNGEKGNGFAVSRRAS